MKDLRAFFGPEGQGGQAIVLIAIMFMALLFAVGLSIDAGQLFAAKRTMQEAADAASFAGAVVFYQSGSTTAANAAAVADATKNGFTDGVNSTTVTVNVPPTSGPYAGESPARHVEVIIVRQVKTTLVPAEAAFNPVRARGVAGAEAFNNQYAIMALAPTCPGGSTATFTASTSVNLHVTGGSIWVNASCATATSGFTSGEDFTLPSPYSLNIVGNTTDTFPAGVAVNRGVAALPDPFAGFPVPDGRSYDGVHTLPADPARIAGTTTAVEGVYTSQLSGVALCHGIYILKGAGMGGDITRDTNPAHVDPNTATACDGRVLIYNTVTNWPNSTGTCADMGASGAHPITLQPLTTGLYAYMQIYQDKACAASLTLGGTNTISAGGTIYMPSGTISLNGNNTDITTGQVVAKIINFQNGNFDITFASGTTASPILPRLSE